MNSVYSRRKSVIGSFLWLSRPFYLHKFYVQNRCSSAGFKTDYYNNTENQDTSSKGFKKLVDYSKESDHFGSLKTSLENDFKLKRIRSSNPVMHRTKIIKIKKPQSTESDVFGNLSEINPVWYSDFSGEPKVDNDLSDDSVIVKNFGKRFRCPEKYLDEMKRLVKEKKIKDALSLFVDMRRNFVTPLKPHYTYMIGVCGRIGYTEMAFKLLRQMTDRAYKPSAATLTGLFNACAESPFPEYGLKKAHILKEKIELKNWDLTQLTYHAMIKAFGKCGDLPTAFKIVDEMARADIKIDVSTYSFLLMSCISNKEAGFTYAVEVWRKMKAKRCNPNIFTCNLLLRAARDCDVGPEEISCLLLQHWSSFSKRPYGFMTKESLSEKPILKLSSGPEHVTSEPLENPQNPYQDFDGKDEKINESLDKKQLPSYEVQDVNNKDVITENSKISTNLLSARPINGPEILEIANIKTRSERLSLIGGMKGFLQFMYNAKINPDMKTFSLLLECLPDSTADEEELLSIIDSYQMKLNIEFVNILIKKRNFRKDTEAAKEVLVLMNKYELSPDIMTFGALTLGCRTLKLASTFIDEMKKFGSSPNIEIVGSLARQACQILDFSYMKYVLKLIEEEEIKPDKKLILTLEKTLSNARKNIILMEQGKEVNRLYHKKNLKTDFKEFFEFYEEWLKRMKLESEEHPWLQYETAIIDNKVEQEQLT